MIWFIWLRHHNSCPSHVPATATVPRRPCSPIRNESFRPATLVGSTPKALLPLHSERRQRGIIIRKGGEKAQHQARERSREQIERLAKVGNDGAEAVEGKSQEQTVIIPQFV